MALAGKNFGYYWNIFKIPFFVLVLWIILGLILALSAWDTYRSIFTGIPNWIITIAAFAFIGYTTIKDHKGGLANAFWAGALCGIFIGLIAGIVGLIMVYTVPALTDMAIAEAVRKGATEASVRGFIEIGAYIGLVTGPLINGIIGVAELPVL